MFPDRCPSCGRPVPSKVNLKVLRAYMFGGTVLAGAAGAALLPVVGFGLGGITAGSLAATLQSGIGSVTAGSAFAILQSLGATGLGIMLFGSVGAAIGILTTYASVFGFCDGH